FAGAEERRMRMTQEALDMARRLGDAPTLAAALSARNFALWAPGHIEERLETANELMRLGETHRNFEASLDGRSWRIIDLLEVGDLHTATAELDALARLADELRQPRDQWLTGVQRAAITLLAGQFDEGMAIARHAQLLGERAEAHNAAPFFLVQ